MSEKSEKNSWDLLDKSRKFKDNLLRLLREDKDVRQEIFSLVNTVERSTQIKENVLNQEDAADSEKSEEFSDLIRKQEIEINNLKKECKNKELQFQLIKEDSLKKIKEYKHIVSELTEKNKQCESDKNKYFMALDTMDAKYKITTGI
jgi:tryptophanyl-tRNA synthetase